MYSRDSLIELVRSKALRFGTFTLASGRTAQFYLDAKQVTLDSQGAQWIGEGMLTLLGEPWPAAVGGMSLGADPITAAMVTVAGIQGRPLRGFMIRKEPKGHGTNRYLEGPVVPGEQVAIVEDVATTGASAIAAVDQAKEFGLRVSCVLAIVDRLEGARQNVEARGYRFDSLLSVRDLGIEAGPQDGTSG